MTAKEHVKNYLLAQKWLPPPISSPREWSKLVKTLESLVATAQREAREEMRERAGRIADRYTGNEFAPYKASAIAIAADIRALSLD